MRCDCGFDFVAGRPTMLATWERRVTELRLTVYGSVAMMVAAPVLTALTFVAAAFTGTSRFAIFAGLFLSGMALFRWSFWRYRRAQESVRAFREEGEKP